MTEKVAMAERASQPSFPLVKGFYDANFLSVRIAGMKCPCAKVKIGGGHD